MPHFARHWGPSGRSLVFPLDLAAAVAVILLLAARVPAAETETAEAVQLRRAGVSPDAAGVGDFLTNLVASPKLQERIERLIADLGSEDFGTREAASRELARIGAARASLTAAVNSPDAEVSHRARRILEVTSSAQEGLLQAALRLIAKEKLPGEAAAILRIMPLCHKDYIHRAAVTALAATVKPADAPLLQTAMASEDRDLRTAAIVGLERAIGPAADATLRPLLKSPDDATRLAAVEALVNRLPRECLGALVALLDSQELAIRAQSARCLRSLTGQHIDFVSSSDDVAVRSAGAAKWRQWVEGPGRTATLRVPMSAVPIGLGRTLVCLFNNGGNVKGAFAIPGRNACLVEIDERDQVKEVGGGAVRPQIPFGCQGLPDGHRIYADLTSQTIVELDAEGKEIWQARTGGSPASVERLENGNTLVALYQTHQVIEISHDGNTAWRLDVGGMASDAHALENGNVLVTLTDQGRIAEYTRAGKEVWKIDSIPNPWSARRLPDGNTLVACYGAGKVIEYTPDGGVAWSHDGVPNCFDAVALENGNVLIGYIQGLREVDRKGKIVKERPIGMVRRISVY